MTALAKRMRYGHVDSEPDHHDQTVQRNQFGYDKIRQEILALEPFDDAGLFGRVNHITIHATLDFA